jgi:hypothetical protein
VERTLRGPGGFFVSERGSVFITMSEGWIKLHRKFEDWEWFNNSEMVHLFIYLLLNANHEDGKWRGIDIKRGQILTGLHTLNEHTKISIQKLRTCLSKLEKTGEINKQTTNKYSIITIINYDSYQGYQQTTNNRPNKQLTNNQQTTNNKQEYKEGIELKNRESEFKELVRQFSSQYPVNMLKSFCDYWTEPNKSKTKMRFELEKTFEISRRLVTWASRDKTFIKTEHAQSEPAYYKPLPKL